MNLFLAYSDRNWPSSRIRAWNVADHWDEATCLNEFKPGNWSNIILQKKLDSLPLSQHYPVYLDLNDPEWWLPAAKRLIKEYLPYLRGVVVSSKGLKADFEKTFQYEATWIDDRQPWVNGVRIHEAVDRPTLLWFGSTGNRAPCLNTIGETFHRLLGENIKFKLLIIDGEPTTQYINEPWCAHINWNRDTIHNLLCACDIALLPDYPGPWGQMKSNNKKATAYWAGLPTHDGIDYFSLKNLLLNYKLRKNIGAKNRETAICDFEIRDSVNQWQELINE